MVAPTFRHIVRRTALGICAGLSAVAGIQCTPGDGPVRGADSTLTIGHRGNEYLLGPGTDDTPKFFLFLPLAMWNGPCRAGEATGLAERWEHTEDRLRWTLHLRRDVRWHDGVPVTAHDIAFSIALWRHPDVQWYGAAAVDSAHAVDDHTVVLFYRRPGTTADLTWDVYYPKHLLEDLDPARFFEWEFWTRPIGNGPYRYVRHDPGTHFELAANPDYYRGEPAIQRVRIRLGSDESHRLNLLAGRVDITRLTSGAAERFLRDDRFAVYYDRTSFAPIRLAWNVRHPLFAEKAIRQALTFGIDRRELAAALGIVEAAPVTDGILSGCLAERGELRSARPYDPARAERILEAAGWRDSDADAVRDKEGVPFRFETIVPVNQEPAAVLVQQQLRRIGVAMELRVMEPTIVNRRFNAGEFEAAVPTLARFDRWIALPHPSSDARTPGNGYDNSRARELWETVARTDSVDELLRVQRELSAIYHEEIPGTFLYARIYATVARSRVHGLDVTPNWLAFPDRLSIAAAR